MKGYTLTKPFNIKEKESEEKDADSSQSKVRITKALITLSDVLRYIGETDAAYVVLGSAGIGILSETGKTLFDLEKGKRTFVVPFRECEICYNCKKGEYGKCSDLQIAGEDFDGFLCDFISAKPEKLFVLPDSVSDKEALFINHISLAIAVYDKLNIKKGDYVAVIGANNFANIFSQLLIYYQAVPIVLTLDEEDCAAVKKSGVYYALGPNDNWQKEVASITSGRMTDKVVYIADCNIPVAKAFSLASFGASVAFTGASNKSGNVSFIQAIKKQLDIHCINTAVGYTTTSINLIANKAINFNNLKIDECSYPEIPTAFKKLAQELEETGKISETIVDMM
ncbi:MAG: alcohol dehydrogenase catalytic domain-containing protein [Clostridia bacterium]|nr:alcohol dehydrogenase catalytic domain-containing protein [Clostridia bacterium]